MGIAYSGGNQPGTSNPGDTWTKDTVSPAINYVCSTTNTWSLNQSVAVPIGSITFWSLATAPNGYLLCDGSAVSRVTYVYLFAVIGITFGAGDGVNTFNVPNLKGRVVVSLDATQSEFNVLGLSSGAKTVTLDTTMIPAHTHVQDPHTHVQNSHTHTIGSTSSATGTSTTTVARGSATNSGNITIPATTATDQNATATNQNTGGGLAHNNLQPYIVLNGIIKT